MESVGPLGVFVGGAAPADVAASVPSEADEWDDVASMILGADVNTLDEGEET